MGGTRPALHDTQGTPISHGFSVRFRTGSFNSPDSSQQLCRTEVISALKLIISSRSYDHDGKHGTIPGRLYLHSWPQAETCVWAYDILLPHSVIYSVCL